MLLKIFQYIAACLLIRETGENNCSEKLSRITLILGLKWFLPITERDPCYFLIPFRSRNTVMVRILGLLKCTRDQISQLARFYNNSPRHSPSHSPFSSFLLLFTSLISPPLEPLTFSLTLTSLPVRLLASLSSHFLSTDICLHTELKEAAHIHSKLLYGGGGGLIAYQLERERSSRREAEVKRVIKGKETKQHNTGEERREGDVSAMLMFEAEPRGWIMAGRVVVGEGGEGGDERRGEEQRWRRIQFVCG